MDASAQVRDTTIPIVINARAGSRTDCRETISSALGDRAKIQFLHTQGKDVVAVCREAAKVASAGGGLIAVAGGDGTVNAAASVCIEHDLTLAIIPAGTFNLVARQHGIPTDVGEATQLIEHGRPKTASVGEVNGQVFLNNASIGLYTQVIEQREWLRTRFGRARWIAVVTGALSMLRGQHSFQIRFVTENTASLMNTSMVFVANNPLFLETLGLSTEACTREGSLGVLLLRPAKFVERLRMLLRSALRQLEEDERLDTFCTEEFEVHSARRQVRIVLDGEIRRTQTPLRFRARPDALRLLVPEDR